MSRWGRVALGFAAVLGVVGCVFLGVFLAGQGLERASLWAAVLGLPVGAVGAAAGLWALVGKRSRRLRPELEAPEGAVGRPAEAEQVVAALGGGAGGIHQGAVGGGRVR
jgi:hypothetical protein